MKNFVKQIIDWLKPDKSIHIMVSTLLTILFFGLFKDIFVSAMLTFFIGFLKEVIWDRWMKKGAGTVSDLFADIIGIIIGVAYLAYILITLSI